MNTIGHNFRFTSFGESHGLAVGGIVDGCPANIEIDFEAISTDLKRRRGNRADTTQRHETDEVEFVSGLKGGLTLGTPIAFFLRNGDCRSADYELLKDRFRAGHADYTYQARYGTRDHRGGGRASGRETATRVVAGNIAKQVLATVGVSVGAEVLKLAPERDGDTRGGAVVCHIRGIKAGVGDPIFGGLDSELAAAAMSIPSATAFEIGCGRAASYMNGSQFVDKWVAPFVTETNHCGGIQGGISNGNEITFTVHFHPVATIPEATQCISSDGTIEYLALGGRHDRCHVHRLPVVVEAMAAIAIANHIKL